MNNYVLFLDDERFPSDALERTFGGNIAICRTFDEAVTLVKTRGLPVHICFDHDLGINSKTGHDFAKWLVEWVMDDDNFDMPPRIHYTIHSQNPIGAENIRGVIDGYHRWLNNSVKL